MDVPLHRSVLLVAAGAVAGSLVRLLVERLIPFTSGDPGFPWATFAVNVVGAFAMGLFLGRVTATRRVPPELTPLIAVGFLGGLTTFSTFAQETSVLLATGASGIAAGYVVASVAFGILAVNAGRALADRSST